MIDYGRMMGSCSPVTMLAVEDTSEIHRLLLDDGGKPRVVPASVIGGLRRDLFRLWCLEQAIYLYPTEEIVEWLKRRIDGRMAVEIGAGNNCLGLHLGIHSTDSYQQVDHPPTAAMYARMNQPPTRPDRQKVWKLDALQAIAVLHPEVVVGAWVTQIYDPSRHDAGGNVLGVDEEAVIAQADYIHLGSQKTHHQKRARRLAHTEERPDGIASRAAFNDDVVYCWSRGALG